MRKGWRGRHRQKERKKGHQTGREDVKSLLFSNDMVLYTENPKVSTKKLLELVSEFCKVSEHKINIQKSVAFLYANMNYQKV